MSDKLSRSRVLRVVYTVLGLLFLGLGFVGVGVLGIPTFDFILLAAFFFAMGNERLHQWIISHRLFGPMIRDYRAGLGFTRRMKITGVVAVIASFALTIGLSVRNLYLGVGLTALAVGICWCIVSRPTKRLEPAAVVRRQGHTQSCPHAERLCVRDAPGIPPDILPDDPPSFLPRTPHRHHDTATYRSERTMIQGGIR